MGTFGRIAGFVGGTQGSVPGVGLSHFREDRRVENRMQGFDL